MDGTNRAVFASAGLEVCVASVRFGVFIVFLVSVCSKLGNASDPGRNIVFHVGEGP